MSTQVETKREQVLLRIPGALNAQVSRMAGSRGKGEWIEGAIREKMARESGEVGEAVGDLPAAARGRVEMYVALLREAIRDEELAKLEAAWMRTEDPEYYGLHPFVPSTLDASIDAMVGRGRSRRTPAASGCM